MSKAKFTKGEWVVKHGSVFPLYTLHPLPCLTTHSPNQSHGHQHNAPLIAAAPEMYKALQSILDSPYTELQEEDFEMIEKTLAKARGEK